MKYIVLIMDGAAGWPLPNKNGRTCLELAYKPHLDSLARRGVLGLARTVPEGMEPSSACACLSIMGYDPKIYHSGRAAIEAKSLGLSLKDSEVAFRCNLVAIRDGKMFSYSSGQINDEESHPIVASLQQALGNDKIRFYPGVGYRHICVIKDIPEVFQAVCTPPHDITNKPIAGFFPQGVGSQLLNDLMSRSEKVLQEHPVNTARRARGDTSATMIWLFWGSQKAPDLPAFQKVYGLNAGLNSAVDLLRGLAQLASIDIINIPGVTAGPDNDYAAQAEGALKALQKHDLVILHIEAPDEAGHAGSIEEKVKAIEQIDQEVISRLISHRELRLLVMPDHPTPIEIQTHVPDPVPFMLCGPGFAGNGATAFTETEAKNKLFVDKGHTLMSKLVSGRITA
jgi:2,3-bisphosphoglycerate-independent phosphoglycerate mutase